MKIEHFEPKKLVEVNIELEKRYQELKREYSIFNRVKRVIKSIKRRRRYKKVKSRSYRA